MKREPKRVLITGSNGLLGQKVAELLSQSSAYALHLTSSQDAPVLASEQIPYVKLDVSDRRQVTKVIDEIQPEAIVNTAAITNVDFCEGNREAAWKVNVIGVENLVHAAKLSGAHLVQVSTDYVFDGKSGPYQEDDRPNPLSYYGRTKLAAENLLRTSGINHTIVRTMVLYGHARKVKPNFALWLVRELQEGRTVRVVSDQIGSPTLADDLAYAIVRIVELAKHGLYHVSGPDVVSRFDFARELAKVFKFNPKLVAPVKTSTLQQPAPRPLRSGLIILRAQVELGISPSKMQTGLLILRNQLSTVRHPVEISPS